MKEAPLTTWGNPHLGRHFFHQLPASFPQHLHRDPQAFHFATGAAFPTPWHCPAGLSPQGNYCTSLSSRQPSTRRQASSDGGLRRFWRQSRELLCTWGTSCPNLGVDISIHEQCHPLTFCGRATVIVSTAAWPSQQ